MKKSLFFKILVILALITICSSESKESSSAESNSPTQNPTTTEHECAIQAPKIYRCGINYFDADNRCSDCCFEDTDCPGDEKCYADTKPCSEIPTPTINDHECAIQAPKIYRCGINYFDADNRCSDCCFEDSDCPGDEKCYADTKPCSEIPTPPINDHECSIQAPKIYRCGINYFDANSRCSDCCFEDTDCPGNEVCFSGTTPCSEIPIKANISEIKMFESCGNEKKISLTFDDGPLIENTMEIIQILNDRNITGSFYIAPNSTTVIGKCEIVKKLLEDGHEVYSHSWTHTDFTTLTNNQIKEELDNLNDWVSDCIGEPYISKIFRPPYGNLLFEQAEYINSLGYIISFWNLDTFDWQSPNDITKIKENINMQMTDYENQSINLLMHDRSIYQILDQIIDMFDSSWKFIGQQECYDDCNTKDGYFCKNTNNITHYQIQAW